jgi:predicted dehydrogenase
MSPERIAEHRRSVEHCGVAVVDTPEAMLGRIDAVLIHSLAGDAHLERARPFLQAAVPTFVDKPFACTYRDAAAIVDLANAHGVALFSSSALPFAEEILDFAKRRPALGELVGLLAYGPDHRADGNPGLFHYGIHTVAILYALMGAGCFEVTSIAGADGQTVTGRWHDGRLATLRGGRSGSTAYGFVAFCERGVWSQSISTRFAYRNLCRAIVDSLRDGNPAVDHATTLEITRFILAAHRSADANGAAVRLDSISEQN